VRSVGTIGNWSASICSGTVDGTEDRLQCRSQYSQDTATPAIAVKALISLNTGLEDTENVTVAFVIAVGAEAGGHPHVSHERSVRIAPRRRRVRRLPAAPESHEAARSPPTAGTLFPACFNATTKAKPPSATEASAICCKAASCALVPSLRLVPARP
jgi:hypothetical protein